MKPEFDKLDINKPTNVQNSLNNLKAKVNDLNDSKLKTLPVDLKKISDIVDDEFIKNTKFNTLNTKVNNLGKKIPDATTFTQINQYNTDKQNLVKKMEMLMKIANATTQKFNKLTGKKFCCKINTS